MNFALIGLIVLVMVFVYLLYYFSRAVSLLQGVTTLKSAHTIAGDKLEVSSGKNVYYDFWLFVVTAPTSDQVLLSREFKIKLNGTSMKLYKSDDTSITGDNANVITYPTGKWLFVSINVNEKVMEVYFNGKLVKTFSMTGALNVSATTNLVVGSAVDGYITKLRRLTKQMSSDFIWSKYLEGNGQFSGVFGGLLNYFDTYHAKVTLVDGDKKKEVKLF